MTTPPPGSREAAQAAKGMPILGRKDVAPFPWHLIEPHSKQAMKNHGQTLERLAERGGLSPSELLAVMEDREWHRMDQDEALSRLATLRAALAAPADGAGEVEAIRARHEYAEQKGGDLYTPEYCEWSFSQCHADRATLLKEHDRQQYAIQIKNSQIEELEELLSEERDRRVEVEGANERRDAKIRRLVEAGLCQMTAGGKHNFLDDIHKLIGADLIATHKDTQDE